jgi:hypothetical protein
MSVKSKKQASRKLRFSGLDLAFDPEDTRFPLEPCASRNREEKMGKDFPDGVMRSLLVDYGPRGRQ